MNRFVGCAEKPPSNYIGVSSAIRPRRHRNAACTAAELAPKLLPAEHSTYTVELTGVSHNKTFPVTGAAGASAAARGAVAGHRPDLDDVSGRRIDVADAPVAAADGRRAVECAVVQPAVLSTDLAAFRRPLDVRAVGVVEREVVQRQIDALTGSGVDDPRVDSVIARRSLAGVRRAVLVRVRRLRSGRGCRRRRRRRRFRRAADVTGSGGDVYVAVRRAEVGGGALNWTKY